MSVFAIADTHLSLGTNKPMDTFTGWSDYVQRLEKNWNSIVKENDTVVIAGDISWAMNFDELLPDLRFIESLNGKKIISKGNHDYWWNTMAKMNKLLEDGDFKTISFLFNNSFSVEGISICGSRGWMFETEEEHDEKVLKREVARIKMSLDSAENDEKIVFLHYPPITTQTKCEEILDLLSEYKIKKCFYGHLHASAARLAVDENVDGIDFKLISADRLKFIPLLIKK
ncbi:MAG: metallophosphoesterase [Eubacterium sp.]|nr:metallophosphoesterase [Eubacterium sp.]